MRATMKRQVFCFIFIVLTVMVAIPVKNIITAPDLQSVKWTKKSFLYNMDFVSSWASAVLYPFGISTDSNHVVIGKDGWLFLGDGYSKTISEDRRPSDANDALNAKKIQGAMGAWNAYLSDRGVKLFRVMIGPNKGTIYPEQLPVWARPASPNAADTLRSLNTENLYIDPTQPLILAKKRFNENLYFKTDTHWNLVGAGVSFKQFAQEISPVAPELQFLTEQSYNPASAHPINGGDLTNFLRISSAIRDVDNLVNLSSEPIQIVQTDYDTNKVISIGENMPIAAPRTPTLVKSSKALNDKKVLWLRDSFGNSQAPFMSATFSQTLQIHWIDALKPGGRFLQLLNDWKPDYVFLTVVERDLRDPIFAQWPPVSFTSGAPDQNLPAASLVGTNSLSQAPSKADFKISGSDAFMDFSLPNTIDPSKHHYMSFDLSCTDGSSSVPMQIFWLADGMTAYDEHHSVTIIAPTGQHQIDLLTAPNWIDSVSVRRIRVDLDPVSSCQSFHFGNPVMTKAKS